MSSQRVLVAATAALLVTAVGSTAASGASQPVVRITPAGASVETDLVVPITGDADHIVFEQYELPYENFADAKYQRLVVRSADGDEQELGAADMESQESVVGNLVTAAHAGNGDDPLNTSNIVDWWSTSTGHHGQVTLPTGDLYLSAGPGGFVYSTPAGVVNLRELSGQVTVLGNELVNLAAKKTTTMPHTVIGMGRAGVLLARDDDTYRYESTSIWLLSYGGHISKLLSSRTFAREPVIAGHLMAWADDAGILRMREI